jgi:hypothetical protein
VYPLSAWQRLVRDSDCRVSLGLAWRCDGGQLTAGRLGSGAFQVGALLALKSRCTDKRGRSKAEWESAARSRNSGQPVAG